jgi:hypothetical protein
MTYELRVALIISGNAVLLLDFTLITLTTKTIFFKNNRIQVAISISALHRAVLSCNYRFD